MDVHYKFSNVSFHDAGGRVISRRRLDHPDRKRLAERLIRRPRGVPPDQAEECTCTVRAVNLTARY